MSNNTTIHGFGKSLLIYMKPNEYCLLYLWLETYFVQLFASKRNYDVHIYSETKFYSTFIDYLHTKFDYIFNL